MGRREHRPADFGGGARIAHTKRLAPKRANTGLFQGWCAEGRAVDR